MKCKIIKYKNEILNNININFKISKILLKINNYSNIIINF